VPSKQLQRQAWDAIAFFLGEGEAPPLAKPLASDVIDLVARTHRLDSALAEPRLTPQSPALHLSAAVWTHWRAAHTAALAQAVHRHARLKEALAALAPLPVIVTKGFAAAELLYPSPAARSMGDVDLLVQSADLERALSRLAPLGYTKQFAGDPILDAPDFHERQLSGPMELDLHQAFVQPHRLPIDYRAVFGRSLAWPSFAPNARLLAPEDAVAYSALHLCLGELTPVWAPAIGLLDLREMLRRRGPFWGFGPPLNPQRIAERATEWHSERMLFVALTETQRLFPSIGNAVAQIGQQLPPRLASLLSRSVVDRAFPPPLTSPPRAEVLFRKALLLRPADRARFVRHALSRRLERSVKPFPKR
jgi:hypothetical protein